MSPVRVYLSVVVRPDRSLTDPGPCARCPVRPVCRPRKVAGRHTGGRVARPAGGGRDGQRPMSSEPIWTLGLTRLARSR
ncbi:MAG TPA: hypothetical protein PLX68_07710, partial [Dermatophilaceae bacterium]|nr:hypothetical protein [Dermatophilaceae bacterium]